LELSAAGSDTYFPTRGWASAAGSVQDEAVLAMNERTRSCYLCLRPGHFLMECPLLGSDVKHATQRQREALFRESPAPTPPPAKPPLSARYFKPPGGIPPQLDSALRQYPFTPYSQSQLPRRSPKLLCPRRRRKTRRGVRRGPHPPVMTPRKQDSLIRVRLIG
jgi:hypothetical protein